jgi:RsiW-degrading membrane proteinase PrsW (M82 family)
MNWLMLAIAPGVAISAYIIFKDEHNREPRKHLIISFLLGALSIIPAMLLELPIAFTEQHLFFKSTLGNALKAYLMVALPEEICKYFMLKRYAYQQPAYDEPFDGIVYAVMVGMGFATVENILYVYQYGMGTGILRMFLAVPAHATFAILMGYFMGKAKFETKREPYLLGAGLFWAILFHGSYNFFLFLKDTQHKDNEFSLLMLLGALISLITGIILSKKAIAVHLHKSASTFTTNNLNVNDQ